MKEWTLSQLEKMANDLNNVAVDMRDPIPADSMLEMVNGIIGGHGVESFEDNNGNWVSYVNMGDTYDLTIYFDSDDGAFHAGSWGDLVESDDERFGEEE